MYLIFFLKEIEIGLSSWKCLGLLEDMGGGGVRPCVDMTDQDQGPGFGLQAQGHAPACSAGRHH